MREPLVLVVSPLSHCIPVPPLIIARLRTFTQPTCLHNLLSSGCAHLRHLFMYHLLSPGCAHLRNPLVCTTYYRPVAHIYATCLCTTYYRPVAHIYATHLSAQPIIVRLRTFTPPVYVPLIIARLRTFTQPTCLHNLLSSGCAHLRHLFMFVYYRPVASNYATFFTLKFY